MLWILFTRADLLLYHIFLPLVIENRQLQVYGAIKKQSSISNLWIKPTP